MKTVEEIHQLYVDRRKRLAPQHARALEIRSIAYNEIVLPFAERDRAEKPAVANILLLGLEQTSMRTASTSPGVTYPILRPGIGKSENAAREREQVNLWWWKKNRMALKRQKRARHLHAYAMSPVLILPDVKKQYPCWHVRDPLGTFAPDMETGDLLPDDCIFLTQRSHRWLASRYTEQFARLRKPDRPSPDDMYDVLEYVDDTEYVMVACARQDNQAAYPSAGLGDPLAELERIPNRAAMPLAVVPGRISLDQAQGQFDGLVGMFQHQAKLQMLELLAMERSVYPETWLMGSSDQTPEVVTIADPIRGIIGVVKNGQMKEINVGPNVLNNQHIDRLERYMRVEGMIPAEFGGESASNIRTGRRGDVILANTVDFQIQAAQQMFEASGEEENKVAIAIDKAYYNTKKTFVISPTKGQLTYTPGELWETDDNTVAYSHAGTDANTLTLVAGQMHGMGALSRKGLMEMHPFIEDVELEEDRLVAEALRGSVLAALGTLAANDPGAIALIGRVAELVETNEHGLVSAYAAANRELQEKQQAAQEGQLPPVEMQPGAVEPQAAIAPPPEALGNLGQLMQKLGQTSSVRT